MNNPKSPPQLEMKSGIVEISDRMIATNVLSLNDTSILLCDRYLLQMEKSDWKMGANLNLYPHPSEFIKSSSPSGVDCVGHFNYIVVFKVMIWRLGNFGKIVDRMAVWQTFALVHNELLIK